MNIILDYLKRKALHQKFRFVLNKLIEAENIDLKKDQVEFHAHPAIIANISRVFFDDQRIIINDPTSTVVKIEGVIMKHDKKLTQSYFLINRKKFNFD